MDKVAYAVDEKRLALLPLKRRERFRILHKRARNDPDREALEGNWGVTKYNGEEKTARFLVGKPNLTRRKSLALAKKLSARGTKFKFSKKPPQYETKTKTMRVYPRAAAIAHEATHSRQHKKLGRWFTPLYGGASALGAAAGLGLGVAKGMRMRSLRRMPKWVPPAVAGAGQIPKLAMETHAALKAKKHEGGGRAAAATLGSYYPMAAATAATPDLARRGVKGVRVAFKAAKRGRGSLIDTMMRQRRAMR